ncbi:MAG: hypothetical protein Q7S86_01685 [bacterium]|nr:hypothetical protein [bacterium]
MEKYTGFWNLFYKVWPPCTRVLEWLGFHSHRQRYLLGHLQSSYNKVDLKRLLSDKGFEHAILAWQDPGEILSMRRIDNRIFQHHIRLFVDGEIRAHYEYSPEAHTFKHFFEVHFEAEVEFFRKLLGECLIAE